MPPRRINAVGDAEAGDELVLAGAIPHHGITEPGAVVRVAWQHGATTFVRPRGPDGRFGGGPIPIAATSRVAEVRFRREPTEAGRGTRSGRDDADPLQRGLAHLADLPLWSGDR